MFLLMVCVVLMCGLCGIFHLYLILSASGDPCLVVSLLPGPFLVLCCTSVFLTPGICCLHGGWWPQIFGCFLFVQGHRGRLLLLGRMLSLVRVIIAVSSSRAVPLSPRNICHPAWLLLIRSILTSLRLLWLWLYVTYLLLLVMLSVTQGLSSCLWHALWICSLCAWVFCACFPGCDVHGSPPYRVVLSRRGRWGWCYFL